MSKDNKSPYYTKSFSVSKENEKDIYDYLIEIEKSKKITEYVKELIRKDMVGGFSGSHDVSEVYIKNLVDKLVEEKLKSLDIKTNDNETAVSLEANAETIDEVKSKEKYNSKNIDKESVIGSIDADVKKKKKVIPKVGGVMD